MTGRVECGVSVSDFWCCLNPGHSGACVPRRENEEEKIERTNREQIKKQKVSLLNGDDAYAILGTVFDWIEENESTRPEAAADLLGRIRDLGFCACTTEFGCVVCGGSKRGAGR